MGKCPVSHRFDKHEPAITRRPLTRLRQTHRNPGRPCRDTVELVFQLAGRIEARMDGYGHETLALTPLCLKHRSTFGALKSEDAKGSFY